MKNRSKKHWIVLVITCSLSAASLGIMNTTGIFFRPVSEELGISTSIFAIHLTILMITGSIMSLFIPKIINKFSFKPVLITSVLIAALSTALMAISESIVLFFILAIIRGLSSAFFSLLPTTMIINKWFHDKHGLATGILFAVSAGSTAIFSPIFANLIQNHSWQIAYVFKGGLLLVLSLPAILYPFSMDPKDDGIKAYGYDEDANAKRNTKKAVTHNTKKVFFLSSFIVFIIMMSLVGTITTVAQHMPLFAESIGENLQVGALLVSAIMIGNVVSKLLIGVISDVFGELKAVLIMLSITLIAVITFLNTTNLSILYLAGFLFGAIFSVGSVGGILLFKKFFGIENFPRLFPIVSLIFGSVAAISIPLWGALYEIFESFTNIFIILIIIQGVVFIFLALVAIRQRPVLEDNL